MCSSALAPGGTAQKSSSTNVSPPTVPVIDPLHGYPSPGGPLTQPKGLSWSSSVRDGMKRPTFTLRDTDCTHPSCGGRRRPQRVPKRPGPCGGLSCIAQEQRYASEAVVRKHCPTSW